MADKNGIFEKVDPGIKIYRSRFKRGFRKDIDLYPGRLYPILADICVPGDIVRPSLRWNIKVNPSQTPFFTPVKGSVFYFAVPFRMIYNTEYGDKNDHFFEDIVTGGKDGNNSDSLPLLTDSEFFQDFGAAGSTFSRNGESDVVGTSPWRPPYLVSLSNCFGYPTFRSDYSKYPKFLVKYAPTETYHRAYWRIVSDYFVDEDTQPDLVDFRFHAVFDDTLPASAAYSGNVEQALPFSTLFSRDYFMSSLKDFLKGTPPALDLGSFSFDGWTIPDIPVAYDIRHSGDTASGSRVYVNSPSSIPSGYDNERYPLYGLNKPALTGNAADSSSPLYAVGFKIPGRSGSTVGAVSVDDMRLAFATQRILERANRCGTRYTEYLLSTFKTSPSDGTLQRPWYLGGVRFNIVTPEVLQTSESGSTPQGHRSGVGFSVGKGGIHTFHCKEWSVLMAVVNIEPEASYCDGLSRQARYASRWDFFNPSMQNLSEQIVEKGEIWSDVTNSDSSYTGKEGFGYQGMWNELRTKMDETSGNFRYSELNNWNMCLRYNSPPSLGPVFKRISTYQSDVMRPFSVKNMPPYLCNFYHDIDWVRPMVRHPVPGLIDHN